MCSTSSCMWFVFGVHRILDMENKFLWKADEQRTKNSNLRKFTDKISKKYRIDFKDSFLELYKWSIKNPENFWSDCWDYTQIIGSKGKESYCNR